VGQAKRLGSDALAPPSAFAGFDFADTRALAGPLPFKIAQKRALASLDFGLSVLGKGYNLFVLGETGAGRLSAVRRLLAEMAKQQPDPKDWCYAANFEQPDTPFAIDLPAGEGPDFAKRIRSLVEELKEAIPRAFDSEEYEALKKQVRDSHDGDNEANFNALREKAKEFGLAVQRGPGGFSLVPFDENGEVMLEEAFNKLEEDKQKAIKDRQEQMWVYVSAFLRQVRVYEKDVKLRLSDLDAETVYGVVDQALLELRKSYQDHPRILAYLRSLQNHLVEHHADFKAPPEQPPTPMSRALGMMPAAKAETQFSQYEINVFVSHKPGQGAPVVCESNPTFYNLFGAVEYLSQMGTLLTDVSMLKAGALHRANGGYLILQAQDLFRDFFTWDSLKRALRNEELRIEELGKQFAVIATASLRPEAIPLKVKIVLIGSPYLYYLLSRWDPDFNRFFKVKSDFDTDMPRNTETLGHVGGLVAELCEQRQLPHFDKDAMDMLAQALSRAAGHQGKLTARYLDLADWVAEAAYWATQAGESIVGWESMRKAMDERVYRSNRVEEKIHELISEGTFFIDVSGRKVGQINGLAVLDMGDYRFGKPSRITVQTFLGRQGFVHIEREVKLSGQSHDKGSLILRGFFLGRFGQHTVPAFGASITFEQEYGLIDGDSASSTELYGLLSSLSGCPIRQDIAVTGSVNQMGEVQPIGGVNEKIEGFYKTCQALGLTGEQGVMIPAANEKHLVLSEEVRQAVAEGRFHVWSVRSIDEGIALLTGVPAGEAGQDGVFPEGSVNRRVMDKIEEYGRRLEKQAKDAGGEAVRAETPAPAPEKPDPHPKLPTE